MRALTILITMFASLASLAQAPRPNPIVKALAAVVIDADTGRVLFRKNMDLPLYPASTTKVMTGLLLAEKCLPDEILTAPADVNKVGESSMHLMPGEQIKASELLYALMLRSANDGCHTVACHISGSEQEFAKLMNERAKQIGCKNTNFCNPHGLKNPLHTTTALDLALMAREAMKNPAFAHAVGTQKKTIERSLNQKDTLMVNRDKWLALDPSAKGVKTGFTKDAGHCFVGCASRNGMTIVTAILKSDAWLADQVALTDWAYASYGLKTIVKKGQKIGEVVVTDGRVPQVALVAGQDLKVVVARSGLDTPTLVWDETLKLTAPVQEGQVVARATLSWENGTMTKIDLLAAQSVEKKPHLAGMVSPFSIGGFLLLAGGALWLRGKARGMADSDWAKT